MQFVDSETEAGAKLRYCVPVILRRSKTDAEDAQWRQRLRDHAPDRPSIGTDVRRCIREGELFNDNAAGKLGL